MTGTISHTDLILNPDGSIYHLHLLPGDIADTIILVGDPGRVAQVAAHFDQVNTRKKNREFHSCTGTYREKEITVISTGIGTDNIDIVVNELDALVNVDLVYRKVREEHKQLNLVRLGTSGALHADIPVGSLLLSEIAGGLDNLYHFYQDKDTAALTDLTDNFMKHCSWKEELSHPYFIPCSGELYSRFISNEVFPGITLSTPGFYGPQLRSLRLAPSDSSLLDKFHDFRHGGLRINNFEMECSALYALSHMLGHRALTLCVAIANRFSLEFLESYGTRVDEMILYALGKLAAND